MADIEINYKGSTIATTSATGTKTLLTSGKYCEDDIEINYTKPSKSYISVKAYQGYLLTCGTQTYQLQTGETEHSFPVDLGVYQVTASLNNVVEFSETVNVDVYGIFIVDFTNRLPGTYQEVEYLESTGSQYITTNVIPNIADFKYQSLGSYVANAGIFGSRQNGDNLRFGLVYYNNYFVPLLGSNAVLMAPYDNTDIHVLHLENNNTTFDGNPVTLAMTGALSSAPSSIFANLLGSTNILASLRVYYCKFYQSDLMVGDYIPCYRKSDNKPGLYDLVTHDFLTNRGTGEFIVGGNV